MQARAAKLATAQDAAAPETGAVVSPELRDRLAALGYVVADRRRQASSPTGLPDPKDVIHLLNPGR
jgi:hypothetical protein